MTPLSLLVRSLYRSWACSYQRPGWCAIGTTPDGRQVVTATVSSPEDALRALLDAA